MDAPLSEQLFTGYYCTTKPGVVVEAHEWEDWEYDDENSVGAVYYAILEKGEEVDGGVLEYQENGESFRGFIYWVQEAHGVSIVAPIAMEGEIEYGDLEEVSGNPRLFNMIAEVI